MFDSTNTSENKNKIIIKLRRSVSQIKPTTDLNLEDTGYEENNFEICNEPINSNTNQENFREKVAGTMLKKKDVKPDLYCWICHFDIDLISCINCPRQFHKKCLITQNYEQQNSSLLNWTCHECQKTILANEAKTVLKSVTPDQFYEMLGNAVKRLKYSGSEPFQTSVDTNAIPDYARYVMHPMDISVMEKKIMKKDYVSLEEILQDMKWIVHNCHIFNGAHSKLTSIAKSLQRMLKHEISEIEVCSDCYLNSIQKNNENWFTEPCRVPHLLVYAKVRGFPYWPAKVLRAVGTEFDVRFFGAHDRSMVPVEKCYWLSKEFPAIVKNYQSNMQRSVLELELHIEKLKEKFGEFKYAEQLSLVDLEKPFVFLEKIPKNNQTENDVIPTTITNESNGKKSEINQEKLNNPTEQVQNELKRSTRLRKFSNKYSNFALEPLKPGLKRKSTSNNLKNSLFQDTDKRKSVPEPLFTATKRIKSDSNNDSLNETPILNPTKSKLNEDISKCDLIVSISDPMNHEESTQQENHIEEHEEEREERIKELRRIEKFLLEEKKQLEILEKLELQKIEPCNITGDVEKIPSDKKSIENNSSPIRSKLNSPIRLKISLNNQDSKTIKSSLIKRSNSMTSVGSNQSSNRCVFNKTKSDQNETSIKLNLGELVRNCKKEKEMDENPSKPVSLSEEKTFVQEEKNSNKHPQNLSKIKVPTNEGNQIHSLPKNESNEPDDIIEIQPAAITNETNTPEIISNVDDDIRILDKFGNEITPKEIKLNDKTFTEEVPNITEEFSKTVDKVNIVKQFEKPDAVNSTSIQSKSTRDCETQTLEDLEAKRLETLVNSQKIMEQNDKVNIEEIRNTYEQLINEIKYNSELKIREIVQESLKEKKKIQLEYEKKIAMTKQKQWCANCGQESIYYCCWNTSYCDEECQKINWSKHLKTCSRIGENNYQSNQIKDSESSSFNNDSQDDEKLINNDIQHEKVKITSTQCDFNFNRHFQHQQQQQRVLKQKRKINSYQNYQQQINQQETVPIVNNSSLLQTPNELYEAQRRIRSQQNFPKQINGRNSVKYPGDNNSRVQL